MRIPERFERNGLGFERVRPEHAAELEPILLDPRVFPTLQDPSEPPPTPADVARSLARKHAHWEEHGFGQWLVRDAADGLVVGRGGLQITRATGVPEVEIGWVTAPERWGGGIATNVAWASIDAAFASLGLDTVMAYTQPGNRASQRVMEKAGLTFQREFFFEGAPFVLYRLRNGRVG